MLIQSSPSCHLTFDPGYRPGLTWEQAWGDTLKAIDETRRELGTKDPLGLSLSLDSVAAAAIQNPAALEALRADLAQKNAYVITINGSLHRSPPAGILKEKAFQPDWRTQVRRVYTARLADLLAALLPEGTSGSIQTIPGSWKAWIIRPDDADRMVREWMDTVVHLDGLVDRTGRVIHVGLEPEPGGYLESAGEVVDFYNSVLLPKGIAFLRRRAIRDAAHAEALIRRHIGICVDACHVAVQFEDLGEVLETYVSQGIRLSKVQLGAALEVFNERSRIEALHPLVEPTLLRQVKAETRHGAIRSWNDLPDALRMVKDQPEYERLRIRFHRPLSWAGDPRLNSTVNTLTPAVFDRLRRGDCEHLEVEVDALAPTTTMAREYAWVLDRWQTS